MNHRPRPLPLLWAVKDQCRIQHIHSNYFSSLAGRKLLLRHFFSLFLRQTVTQEDEALFLTPSANLVFSTQPVKCFCVLYPLANSSSLNIWTWSYFIQCAAYQLLLLIFDCIFCQTSDYGINITDPLMPCYFSVYLSPCLFCSPPASMKKARNTKANQFAMQVMHLNKGRWKNKQIYLPSANDGRSKTESQFMVK